MPALLQHARKYFKKIMSRKIRLVMAFTAALCLFIVSCIYLYNGFNKTFILYTLLCVLTGALLVCPRPESPYLRWFFLLLYIIAVPHKMFQRLELPVHNMTGLSQYSELINIFIILLIYAIFLLIFQRVNLALGGGSILLLVLMVLNFYCYQSHGSSFHIHNWKALETALPVLNSNQPAMNRELWYSILYFVFFIVFGFWCSVPPLKKRTLHLAATLIPLGYFAFFFCIWNISDFPKKYSLSDQYQNAWEPPLENGFLYSFLSHITSPSPHEEKWYEQFPIVSHALGLTEDGDGGTNSREALEYNYRLGQRVFETDIAIASDNVAVLRHDWDMDLGQEEGFGWTEDFHYIPTSSQFLQIPIYGKYTPMSLLELYEVMDEKKDMYVVIDPKITGDVIGQFTVLVNTALDNGYESVLDRIVVQLYFEDMYNLVESVYHFKNYLYTLYYIGYPGSDSIGTFCQKNDIPVVVMPYTDINAKYCQELHNYSLRVYGHTVNETDDARKLISMNTDGLYSETILPKDMKAWLLQAALLLSNME